MKRVGYLIEKIADLDNLYLAYIKACRGKRTKVEVKEFSKHLSENFAKMQQEILEGRVTVGNYTCFQIRDPKPRTICAASFYERVLHHAIMNVCHPYFDRGLIYDTYATRPGKGIYSALERAKKAMAQFRFVAKLDVRKYFDSIQHSVLKTELRRIFKDGRLLRIFDSIIDSYSVSDGCGLPIGNLTSQYFANLYLSRIDHQIKEQFGIKAYVRYMDDMLLFSNDRLELQGIVRGVEILATQRGLMLKAPLIKPTNLGMSFLGYRVRPYYLLLGRVSKQRFSAKLKNYTRLLTLGLWSERRFAEHITPLFAFVDKASTFGLRRDLMQKVAVGGWF